MVNCRSSQVQKADEADDVGEEDGDVKVHFSFFVTFTSLRHHFCLVHIFNLYLLSFFRSETWAII